MKHLQLLCGASGVLPTSFTLADDLDNIEARSFASGGFADLYRATHKGKRVVVKILKATNKDDLENVQKVRTITPDQTGRSAHVTHSSALSMKS